MISFNRFSVQLGKTFFVESKAINFVTKGKSSTDTVKTTALYLIYRSIKNSTEVNGEPQDLNNRVFRGLLVKMIFCIVKDDGNMGKFSAFVNPYNIAGIEDLGMPGICTIIFYDGSIYQAANDQITAVKLLINHKKQYLTNNKKGA